MTFKNLYNKLFEHYSNYTTSHIRFKDIIYTSKINRETIIPLSTKHIHNELPIRLAHRINELNLLPYGLSHNSNINLIRNWYLSSFEELINLPKNYKDVEPFKYTIRNIYERHSPTLTTLAKAIYEIKESGKPINLNILQDFLDKFHTNRTEIRILIQQYLKLFENDQPNHFGIINKYSSVENTIDNAKNAINYICRKSDYEIDISKIIEIKGSGTLAFIDNYLYYILFEILKNSVQAVIDSGKKHPKIKITIQDISSYIYVTINDNGIGILDKNLDKIWLYSFSTNPIPSKNILLTEDFSNHNPLSGFGYGLPISKIYLNFFDSFIKIESQYKIGTTTHLFLKKY